MIGDNDSISTDFTKDVYVKDGFIKGVITRSKVTKINGIRHYFYYKQEGEENLIAKAKTFNSDKIPITIGNEIHLSSSNFIGELHQDYHHSHFALVTRESNPDTVMDVDFQLPRQKSDGNRKTRVFFLFEPLYPSPLVNAPITDDPEFGEVYRQISIKNCILKDEKNDQHLIIIRKTEKDKLEIASKLNIIPVCMFALGIAAFLGRKPQ